MTKICPNCKAKNNNKAEFCQSCGQDLSEEKPLKNESSSNRSSYVGIVIVLIVIAISGFFIWGMIIAPSMNAANLQQNGINGTAVILKTIPTQTWVNGNPEIDFTVMVTVPGKAPYQANYSQVVQQALIPQYQPGDKFYVLVDPKNPQNLEFSDHELNVSS